MCKIPAKESLSVEFKSDKKCLSNSILLDAVVGLANTDGGTLYLGVEDDGEITGLHRSHMDVLPVMAFVANNTVPSVSVRTEIVRVDDIPVLRIDVPKSRSIVATGSGKILRRRLKADGSPENVPLYPFEIPIRLSELGAFDFSAQIIPNADFADLSSAQILHLRHIIAQRHGEAELLELSDQELLEALRLTVEHEGRMLPTIAGLLLLGKEESLARFIPTAQTAFQVLEGSAIRLDEQTRLPLLAVFEKYAEYFKAWNPERDIEQGLFRTAIPEFSPAAFREALVNAFCHRDYAQLGMTLVQITEEGMTIENPGGFIEGISLRNLISAAPRGRNPALADAMKRIGLAERTGRGIDRIFAGSIIYGRPWPDYSETTENNVRVFIARAKPNLAFMKLIQDEQQRTGNLPSIHALLILSALQMERRLTFADLGKMTHLSEHRIRANLERMVEHGVIEAKGSGKNRSYMLSAQMYAAANETAAYVRQAGIEEVRQPELILRYVQAQGSITRGEAADLLRVSDNYAYVLLKRLTEEDRLRAVGQKRGRKYVLSTHSH